MDISETVMTFGKHKGKQFIDIPRNYLEWLEREKICREPLASIVSKYLRRPINWTAIPDEPENDDIPF